MTLADVVVMLEKATGPDSELDAQIAVVVGIRYRSRRNIAGQSRGREWLEDSHGGIETWARHPPTYTSSIDAAMTLVPEGHDWIIGRTNEGLTIHACCGSEKEHFADTPAIALCIAALRARASQYGEG